MAKTTTRTLRDVLTDRTEQRVWDLLQAGTPLDKIEETICPTGDVPSFVRAAINRVTDKTLEHNAARSRSSLDGGIRYPDPMPGPCACHPEGGA